MSEPILNNPPVSKQPPATNSELAELLPGLVQDGEGVQSDPGGVAEPTNTGDSQPANTFDGGDNPQGQDPNNQDPTPGQIIINGVPFPIDQKYADLPPEVAVHHTMQSHIDKTKKQYESQLNQLTEYEKQAQFLGMLLDDDEVARAFVSERLPDLVENVNVDTMIDKELAKEFPDFNYEEDYNHEEAQSNPRSKSAKYLRRLQSLESKFTNQPPEQKKTIKQLLETKRQAQAEKIRNQEQKVIQLRQNHRIDDTTWNVFTNWVDRVVTNPEALYTIFQRAGQINTQQFMSNIGVPTGAPQDNNFVSSPIPSVDGNTWGKLNKMFPRVNPY